MPVSRQTVSSSGAVRRSAAAVGLAAIAATTALLCAPSASATDGSVFSFPRLGTVVVTGTVDNDVNFTVYRILDPTCTGTAFPGPDNSCVPQQATDTIVIPAGTYNGKQFRLNQIPTCGPTQQDIYEGAYQPTVTASGTHNYLAGGILQLGTCVTSTPSSTPTSPSPTPTTSTTTTPSHHATTPAPSTTPTSPTSTPTTPATSGGVLATGGTYPSSATQAAATAQLAYTGTSHTGTLLLAGFGALTLGAACVAAGRRGVTRSH